MKQMTGGLRLPERTLLMQGYMQKVELPKFYQSHQHINTSSSLKIIYLNCQFYLVIVIPPLRLIFAIYLKIYRDHFAIIL